MLFGALLAPAILAGGLLAGEMKGFERDVRVTGAGHGVDYGVGRGGGMVVLAPVRLPAPAHPDRVYEGVVPVVVREAAEPVRPVPVVPAPESEEKAEPERVAVEERVTPVPAQTEASCPGEWADTWLWELCRDRQQAVDPGTGADRGLLPGI
ncbi:hypothetical protein E1267_12720 [Nonomuraea longispora]|uniref:Uncharacterized protein n=1 Tax=Nonomuraea longispora TaxID=1848320 RepID=A0A4R4NJ40_9ACTN|nr:hypothetical protein E1267_12720 [Nonomuraea longispora]